MRTLLAAFLVAVMLAGRLHGQAAGADAPGDLTPAEIQKMFDAMVVVDAERALTLDDKQYPTFLTRLRELQDIRRRHLVQRTRLMGELQRMTK